MSKRKQVILDLKRKLQVFKDIDDGASYSNVTSKYGIGKATVANIKKIKDKIMANLHENNVPSNRNLVQILRSKKALFTWCNQERTKGSFLYCLCIQVIRISPISGEILRERPKFFYKEITQKEDFNASSGWLQKFKTRFGIGQLTICGESLSSAYDAVLSFVEKLAKLIKKEI
ncbi:hypothetical protein NQ314_018342 [Rhamnusium bicolor]|uniref:HTH CENPB-type domain-containing protein n=1 Tax=Rhamnusium bicolor TaxID=1586634 RepID=A0AAV8WS91_9CUCU|nr:hypothetical protein NQ314_018342 [Rhamnusium bicolor]